MSKKRYIVRVANKTPESVNEENEVESGNIPITDSDLQERVASLDSRVAEARKVYNNEVMKANGEMEVIRKEQVARNKAKEQKNAQKEKQTQSQQDNTQQPDNQSNRVEKDSAGVGGSSEPAS